MLFWTGSALAPGQKQGLGEFLMSSEKQILCRGKDLKAYSPRVPNPAPMPKAE